MAQPALSATSPQPAPSAAPSRCLPNFIEGFLSYTASAPSPELFRKWAGVFIVSSALSKRVWTPTKNGPIYPNMLVVLNGNSSMGKGKVIKPVGRLLKQIDYSDNPLLCRRGIRMGAGRLTSSGLFNFLNSPKSEKSVVVKGKEQIFRSGIFIAEEAGTLLSELKNYGPGLEFGAYLIHLLNADDDISRTLAKDETDIITVENPSGAILVGLQSKLLMTFFPEEAWSQGLAARAMFVYPEKPVGASIFGTEEDEEDEDEQAHSAMFAQLVSDLEQIASLSGRFLYDHEAKVFLDSWWGKGTPSDGPQHPMLESYCFKRIEHLIRLCMTVSVSRSNDMIVTRQDAEDALELLREIESRMPTMFDGAVNANSDNAIMQEVAHAVKVAYELSLQKGLPMPVPHHIVLSNLHRKVPAHRAEQVLDSMLVLGLLRRVKATGTKVLPGNMSAKAYLPGEQL